MHITKLSRYFILLFGIVMIFACAKQNLRNAEKSLTGNWVVTEIYSAEGERLAGGISIDNEETETGELGEFIFSEDDVTYNFTRLDSLYEDQSGWTLQRERVNQGFTKVEVYTLNIDQYDFVCEFGDSTSDAEKNASEVRLIFETQGVGAYSTFHLTLDKE